MYKYSITAIISALFFLITSSCEKEEYLTSNAQLYFSTDTISFDTVFNTIATSTRKLMVYNRYNKSLKISSITLAGGTASAYKINIDGLSKTSVENIELYPKDSMYIFVQLVNPQQNNNQPINIDDELVFSTNEQTQKVLLRAWGQNVIILRDKHIATDTFTSAKPYLVYGTLTVDSGQLLTLEAGTRIFFHNKAKMIVKGSIQSKGELNKPVLLACDRFDNLLPDISYKIIGGLWSGIEFESTSENNIFAYTEIRNAITAIKSTNANAYYSIKFEFINSQILHNSFCGFYLQNSSVKLVNTVIANAGSSLFTAFGGGQFEFIHCTLADFFEVGQLTGRNKGDLVFLTDTFNNTSNKLNIYFGNTVLVSNYGASFNVNTLDSTHINYRFENCFLDLDYSKFDTTNISNFKKNKFSTNRSLFKSNSDFSYNFTPDTLSVLINIGSDSIAQLYPLDIKGQSRISTKSDIGAIERIEK